MHDVASSSGIITHVGIKRPPLLAAIVSIAVSAAVAWLLGRKPVSNNSNAGDATEKRDRVFADDLDKELIDQLHAATLNASDSCFELKKLCATVLIPTGTLVALFSGRRLNMAAFVAGLFVIGFFWLADAVGYYYQRKLRTGMESIWLRRAERCEEPWKPPHTEKVSPVRAAFNGSMTFYALLAIPVLIAMLLYLSDLIASPDMVSP